MEYSSDEEDYDDHHDFYQENKLYEMVEVQQRKASVKNNKRKM
jgi:hypothetical protein